MLVPQSDQPDGDAVPQLSPGLQSIVSKVNSLARHRSDGAETMRHDCGSTEVASNCDRRDARTSNMKAMQSHSMVILPPFAAAFAVRFGGAKAVLECPKHITDTQALIDRVSARFERDRNEMHHDVVGAVYALLDDAKMLLSAARQNHEEPQGPFDHARAFAKVDIALGHARAAEILHSEFAKQRCRLGANPKTP